MNYLQDESRRRYGLRTSKERCNRHLFHILANYASINASTPTQMNGLVDSGFTVNNNAYVLVDNYKLCGIFQTGLATVYADIYDAYLNSINIFQVYPINAALDVASNPNFVDLRKSPQPLPVNEQIEARANNAAGGAAANLQLWFIKPNSGDPWDVMPGPGTLQNPRTLAIFTTSSIVGTAGVWSPLGTITFTNPLRGGNYMVEDCYLVASHGIAFRLNFPVIPFYNGRKLSPGGLCQNAYGDLPEQGGNGKFGAFGVFNYFETPQIQVLLDTTGTASYTGYMWLRFLGPAGVGVPPYGS